MATITIEQDVEQITINGKVEHLVVNGEVVNLDVRAALAAPTSRREALRAVTEALTADRERLMTKIPERTNNA